MTKRNQITDKEAKMAFILVCQTSVAID